MRTQRRPPQTVTIVHVDTTEDRYGNSTGSSTSTTVEGALFEAGPVTENAGTDQARVLDGGLWNLPGVHQLDADDLVRHGLVTWQVVGGSTVQLDRTEVPVTRARKV